MELEGQYLTYEEYKALGGTLDQTPFKVLEYEARQSIDRYTFGRLKDFKEQNQEVKMCIYSLINMMNSYKLLEEQNKGIASENTDGYSVSYITPSKSVVESKNSEIKGIIKEYLADCKLEDGTPYLYRGIK